MHYFPFSLGLHLVLYIEHDDYIKGIQQGRGLRVFVHPFGTQPFVEESGFAVPTGFQTFAAMRQVWLRVPQKVLMTHNWRDDILLAISIAN